MRLLGDADRGEPVGVRPTKDGFTRIVKKGHLPAWQGSGGRCGAGMGGGFELFFLTLRTLGSVSFEPWVPYLKRFRHLLPGLYAYTLREPISPTANGLARSSASGSDRKESERLDQGFGKEENGRGRNER